MEKQKGDRLVPDFKGRCVVCGASPTVVVIPQEGAPHALGLCGVCTFGTVEASDVEYWASDQEEKKGR